MCGARREEVEESWVSWELVLLGVWLRFAPHAFSAHHTDIFTNCLVHNFLGKSLDEDFEHVLIVNIEIGL